MNSNLLGDWLKTERQARGLTQGELEARAKLGHAYVSKVERGRTKLPEEDTRERIHKVLGTSEDDLVEAGVLRKVEHAGNVVYLPQMPEISRMRVGRPTEQGDVEWTEHPIAQQAIRELSARYDTKTSRQRLHELVDRLPESKTTALLLLLEVFEDTPAPGSE